MSKKITIADVAREANVSKATVSYILNGKHTKLSLSAATVARVLSVCEKTGYRPDETAVALSDRRSIPLNMLVMSPWLYAHNSDFMLQVYAAFKEISSERGMNIAFMPYEDGALSKTLRPSKCKKYDALVLIGTSAKDEEWVRKHADEYDGKIIALNRLIESEFISSVYGNDYEAEYALASSVVLASHYKSYVIVNEGVSDSRCRSERIRALRDVLSPYDTKEVAYGSPTGILETYKNSPINTCFFFTMYMSSSLFISMLSHSGVSIPETCGITGYDIHTILEPYLPISITTVNPRVSQMVECVCDTAFSIKDGASPCSHIIKASLVNGSSAIKVLKNENAPY